MKKKAVRNIKLCTKDCLCLYVCPTGASDTETGQIDANKCIGCGACANSCPSHAISIVPYDYPAQQEKTNEVKKVMMYLVDSKIEEKKIFTDLASNATDQESKVFFKALAMQAKYSSEDLVREASFLLPQGSYSIELLESLLDNKSLPNDIIKDIKRLIELLKEKH